MMIKLTALLMFISSLGFADVATWNTFKTADKYFKMELPCLGENKVVKTDENKIEKLYKCSFAGTDYAVTQVVYTKAGKKKLENQPSYFVENTTMNLMAQYKKDGISLDLNKSYRQHPYRVLNLIGSTKTKKYFTTIYDGPEAQLILTATGPTTEEYNLKHVIDSIKPD